MSSREFPDATAKTSSNDIGELQMIFTKELHSTHELRIASGGGGEDPLVIVQVMTNVERCPSTSHFGLATNM